MKWIQFARTIDLIWFEILIRLFNGWADKSGREANEGASNEENEIIIYFELNEKEDVGKKKGIEGT